MADGPADIPWLECLATPVDVNISDVLDPPRESAEDRSRRCRCEAWLRAHLADRLPHRSKDVEDAAASAGLRRARERVVD
jgi:hypothetical protein